MKHCIETRGLSHRFAGGQAVLQDINLQVPQGAVYGFLGPNGAGKTTTLRLLLGLLKKQQGDIFMLNRAFADHRIDVLKQTGSLIEAPSLYGHLTACENLEVWRRIYRCPAARIKQTLEIVGLADTGNKKVSRFSLGMKQRLSIGVALLHNPLLLILDEPTNGLDPNGIIDMRDLLRRLNTEFKMTILVSSHLLAEVEKMASHIGIIHKGSLLFQGSLEELRLKQRQQTNTCFDTGDPERTLRLALEKGLVASLVNGQVLVSNNNRNDLAQLNEQLVNHHIPVFGIYARQNNLESIFMDLVNN